MRRTLYIGCLLVAALMASLGGARPALACAACGCGDTTLTATGVERPYRNRIRAVLDERYGSFSQGDGIAGEHVDFLKSSLALSWSPFKRVTLAATLPWVTSWLRPSGGARTTVNGLGDFELALRGVVYQESGFAPHHVLWVTGGLKFPTGYRAYDAAGYPVPDDDQPGSGSFDPFAGATYAWFSEHLLSLFASVSGRYTTDGWHGYRRGSSVAGSAALQIQPWGWGALQAGSDWIWQASDELGNGSAMPNTGGVIGYVMVGVLANPWRDLLLRAVVDAPVVTVLNGTQTIGPQVVFQVAYDFK